MQVHNTLYFYPSFQLPPALSHQNYKSLIKTIKSDLIRYKCWLLLLLFVSKTYAQNKHA